MTALRKLNAHFVGDYQRNAEGRITYRQLPSVEGAQGISFQCPVCAQGKEYGEDPEDGGVGHFKGAHYVLCWFRNPRTAPPVPDDASPGPGRWWFTGETIDDITFTGPGSYSVLLTGEGCGWHGFIVKGEATLS